MRTIEPARIIAGIGRDQFAEHVLVEAVQRPRDLTALFEIEDTIELSDDGNGSSKKPAFFLWIIGLDPGPGEFNRLDSRVVEQHDDLDSGRCHHLRLPILVCVLSEHRSFPWTLLIFSCQRGIGLKEADLTLELSKQPVECGILASEPLFILRDEIFFSGDFVGQV